MYDTRTRMLAQETRMVDNIMHRQQNRYIIMLITNDVYTKKSMPEMATAGVNALCR